jgi:hypothetical protein
MKVLSVRQPWAMAIVLGLKDIENRTRGTSHRGRFLVHATKWRSFAECVEALDFIRPRVSVSEFGRLLASLPTGQIIGVASIDGVVSFSSSRWFVGPVGYSLNRAQAAKVKPIEIKGRLGFWDYDGPFEVLR